MKKRLILLLFPFLLSALDFDQSTQESHRSPWHEAVDESFEAYISENPDSTIYRSFGTDYGTAAYAIHPDNTVSIISIHSNGDNEGIPKIRELRGSPLSNDINLARDFSEIMSCPDFYNQEDEGTLDPTNRSQNYVARISGRTEFVCDHDPNDSVRYGLAENGKDFTVSIRADWVMVNRGSSSGEEISRGYRNLGVEIRNANFNPVSTFQNLRATQ